ncbi:MAG: TetR/AcrR family transcriptional regulator [Bacteroidota bacterium]
MGIKERRLREIESQKTAILEATRKLAIQKGWPDVSIRKIADIIEYTPPVIYERFKNKEAILIELESQGFRKLKYTIEEAREQSNDPHEQLTLVSAAFWDWAFAHAELYQVMFNLQGVQSTPPSPKSLRDSANCVIEILRQIHLFSSETEGLFFHWWSIVHGHVSLVMSGQIGGMNSQMRRYMLNAVERFGKSLS